jgi:pimeloyl-ACP methyl ester carboxylesterase
MNFHTFGNDSGKTILLIHGMLNPWQIWKEVSDAFSNEYYVIIPELDAHTQEEASEFISVDDEAVKIRDYLQKNGKENLYMTCGLSMGGRIAAVLAGMPEITVENLILDGAPLLVARHVDVIAVRYRADHPVPGVEHGEVPFRHDSARHRVGLGKLDSPAHKGPDDRVVAHMVRLVVGPGEVLVIERRIVQLHGLCAARKKGDRSDE